MHELSHIYVLNRSVNFDLTHKLLFCSTSLETCLLNYLSSRDIFIVALDEFVAFCKATFAQEFTLDILPVAYFTVLMFYSLLDNLGRRLLLIMQVCLTTSVSTRSQSLSTSSTSLGLCSMNQLSLSIKIRHISN